VPIGSFGPVQRQGGCLQFKLNYPTTKAMRWLKATLRSSLYGLLHHREHSDSRLDSAADDIRDSMLALLGASGAAQFPQVVRRVRYAEDLQALWYLRGDLMAAVAAIDGEFTARKKIASITAQFEGLLPGGLSSRPSPLA
jgi:hypothetical protein